MERSEQLDSQSLLRGGMHQISESSYRYQCQLFCGFAGEIWYFFHCTHCERINQLDMVFEMQKGDQNPACVPDANHSLYTEYDSYAVLFDSMSLWILQYRYCKKQ